METKESAASAVEAVNFIFGLLGVSMKVDCRQLVLARLGKDKEGGVVLVLWTQPCLLFWLSAWWGCLWVDEWMDVLLYSVLF